MEWQPGYREWAPPPELGGSVACLWARVVPSGAGQTTLVLPDACCDLIWQSGRGAFVAGPDTGPWPSAAAAGTVMAGVRLRPGAGGPALGLPLSVLLDQRVEASDLETGFGARLARSLGPALGPAEALRLLASEVRCLVLDHPADPLAAEAARLLGRPRAGPATSPPGWAWASASCSAGAGPRSAMARRRCGGSCGSGGSWPGSTPGKASRARRIWPGWPLAPATPTRRT